MWRSNKIMKHKYLIEAMCESEKGIFRAMNTTISCEMVIKSFYSAWEETIL